MLLLFHPFPAIVARLLWLAFIILINQLPVKAQTTNNWYLSKILNDNKGLPQNAIRSMYYDRKADFL